MKSVRWMGIALGVAALAACSDKPEAPVAAVPVLVVHPLVAAGDGAMVFRKVMIPVAGPLDDYPINIGQDSAEVSF